VSVDSARRRPLYHVLYDDGDDEDYDEAELQYALEFHVAIKTGGQLTVLESDVKGFASLSLHRTHA
jgi:hypothetical protein